MQDDKNYIYDDNTEAEFNPSIQQSLKNIAEKEDFITYKISNKIIPTNGDSYFGDLYEIDISGKTKEGYRKIHLFLKNCPSDEALKPILDIRICYLHEILFYNELSHVFNMLQEDANIEEKERFKIAKSYECNQDAIILENLTTKGFKTLHRMDVMPLKFAELAIAQLAKLHGLSFVLKHKKRDYFEKKIKTLKTALHCNDLLVWEALVTKHFETSIKYFDKDIQMKIENFKTKSFHERFIKYYSGVTDNDCESNSVKCLCHGDLRINNAMFKDDDEGISEVVLIDYQMMSFRSPVTDLFHFIYTGTDGKFRKAHLTHLRDHYHEELTKFLTHFNLDINEVYPKKVYEKEFHDSMEFGLMIALQVSPIIFTVAEQAQDFGKGNNIDSTSCKLHDKHKEWITEIVEEFMAWGILK